MSLPIWTLNNAGTELLLDFPTQPPARFRLDADGVDELIASLASMRMTMSPPVPLLEDPDPGSRAEVALLCRWYVLPMSDGKSVALGVLHPGHRWVWVKLEKFAAEALSEKLRATTRSGE